MQFTAFKDLKSQREYIGIFEGENILEITLLIWLFQIHLFLNLMEMKNSLMI